MSPASRAQPQPAQAIAVDEVAPNGPLAFHAFSRTARPVPPYIRMPLPGEPSDQALEATVRLVPATCDAQAPSEVDARVAAMKKAVDAAFKSQWHDEQPACWQADRDRDRWRREEEAELRRPPVYARPSRGLSSLDESMMRPMPRSAAADGAGSVAPTPAPASPARLSERRESGAAAIGASANKASSAPAAKEASGTNNQVAGVDEADFVKNDGRYVYVASNGALHIVEALSAQRVSRTPIVGNVREMFVDGDRAVVFTASSGAGNRCTYGYDCVVSGDGSATRIVVLDIADRASPKVLREIDLTGSLISARRVGNIVHTVVTERERAAASYATWPAGLPRCGTDEGTVRRVFAKLKEDNERVIRAEVRHMPRYRDHGAVKNMCGAIYQTRDGAGTDFTSILSFDLAHDTTPAASVTVRSAPGVVFGSENALYLSTKGVGDASHVHKFGIGAEPSATKYTASGVVPGHALNQFAMDEWNGYLRLATTKGRVPDPNVSSSVSVLSDDGRGHLVRVGAIDNIARGEDIRSVRFDDDRGYIVTFKKTDPLFVMDLAQPSRPAILGELKIPGFSTYMHRIDDTHLLSIGLDANDHGSFAYFDGVILQLFDVSNPTDPKLMHKEKIGTRGSSSQALADHLAFTFVANRGLLAVPMTVCEGGGDGRNGNELAFSGLLVYGVDLERGFVKLGGIDHGTRGANCGTWWSNANSTVKRSIFLDDLVYSVAMDRVKVQRMPRFGEDVADLSLLP